MNKYIAYMAMLSACVLKGEGNLEPRIDELRVKNQELKAQLQKHEVQVSELLIKIMEENAKPIVHYIEENAKPIVHYMVRQGHVNNRLMEIQNHLETIEVRETKGFLSGLKNAKDDLEQARIDLFKAQAAEATAFAKELINKK